MEDRTESPTSLYAATKKANEHMSYCYSHLYGIPQTGLRFFTVYGPWGRPDMALYLFTRAILEGRPIDVFNDGDMKRDFTYIDDIVAGVVAALDNPPDEANEVPNRLYNLGNQRPEPLMRLIAVLEDSLGLKAEINFRPLTSRRPMLTSPPSAAIWATHRPRRSRSAFRVSWIGSRATTAGAAGAATDR